MIEKFIEKIENQIDNDIYSSNDDYIKINQLIKIDENIFKVVAYAIANPSTIWYPERFEIIDEIIEAYEYKTKEEGFNPICTIYSETIPNTEKQVANMFIKNGNEKTFNVIDYSKVVIEINSNGELCMMGAEKYSCKIEKFNKLNTKNKRK